MKVNNTSRFRRAEKRLAKRRKDKRKLDHVIESLLLGSLDPKYKDHMLKGDWAGFRECHIEPDWLLVYRIIDNQILELYDTGTHQDLFGK